MSEQNIWFMVLVVNAVASTLFDGDRRKAYFAMKTTGAIDDLATFYNVLHTQSIEYIVEDVKDILDAKGVQSASIPWRS
jgi:hypothetical protein